MTWGGARQGGDSSAVQDQLKSVQQIKSSRTAFAAILGDGSVVTWGEPCFGAGKPFCAGSAEECAAARSH